MDTQRIVDFKLKPWADRFLTLRASLYEDENEMTNENGTPPPTPTTPDDQPAPVADDTVRNGMMERPRGGMKRLHP